MTRFEPVNESHSIVSASLVLKFSPPLPDEAWPEMREAMLRLREKHDLPRPLPVFGLSLSFDGKQFQADLNSPPPTANMSSGLAIYNFTDDDDIVEQISMTRDALNFRTFRYIRWNPFIERAMALLNELLPLMTSKSEYASTQLEYVDRFECRCGDDVLPAKEILRDNSPYIPPLSQSADDLWHSYCGRFERLDERTRRLINVRLDYNEDGAEASKTRVLNIVTMLMDTINQDGFEPTDRRSINMEFIQKAANSQHVTLKDILRSIISQEAVERIGLTGGA